MPKRGPCVANIFKVVTAFTLAHSITLSLAAFDIIRLPSRLTESVIAASIVVAALNNVFPLVTEARWRIAFAFGLLHGFGFASVLSEMGLPQGARLISLVAFNLGVSRPASWRSCWPSCRSRTFCAPHAFIREH